MFFDESPALCTVVAGEKNIWWGNCEKRRGPGGEAPRKLVVAAPFKRLENAGNAYFDIFVEISWRYFCRPSFSSAKSLNCLCPPIF